MSKSPSAFPTLPTEGGEQELLRHLTELGIEIDDPHKLRLQERPADQARAAVDLIVSYLEKGDLDDRLKNWYAQAIAIKALTSPYWDRIVRLYRHANSDEDATGFAVVLSNISGKREVPEIMALVRDQSLGISRTFLLRRLMISGGPEGAQLVASLQDQPGLGVEATRLVRQRLKRSSSKNS